MPFWLCGSVYSVFLCVPACLYRVSLQLKQQRRHQQQYCVCNKSSLSSSSWPPAKHQLLPLVQLPPIPSPGHITLQCVRGPVGPPPLPGSLPAHIPLACVIVQSDYSWKTNASSDSKKRLLRYKNIVFRYSQTCQGRFCNTLPWICFPMLFIFTRDRAATKLLIFFPV